jgi:hypothetical protein
MAHAPDLKQLHDLSRLNKAGRKFMVRFFYLDTVIAGSVLRPLNFSQAVAAGMYQAAPGVPHISSVVPIKKRSHSRAAPLPSLMAQTTRL